MTAMRSRFLTIILSLILILPVFIEQDIKLHAQTKTTTTRKRTNSNTKTKTTKSTATKTSQNNKASNQTTEEVKRKKDAAKREILVTEQQIRENDSKIRKELLELGKLEEEISATQGKINSLNKELKSLSDKISGLEESISKNEEDLEYLREEYLKAVKKMRVTKKSKSDMAFIFSATSFNQANRRMRYLKEFSSWKDRQTTEINTKVIDLQNEKTDLAQAKEQEKNALALQKYSIGRLENQKLQQTSLVAQLKENGIALEKHLQRKENEARELDNMISRMIAEEQKRAKAEEERKAAEEKQKQENAQSPVYSSSRIVRREETPQADAKTSSRRKNRQHKEETTANNKKEDKFANARKRAPRNRNANVQEEPQQTAIKSSPTFAGMKGSLPNPVSGRFNITSRFGSQKLPDMPDVTYDNPGIDAEVDAGATANAVYRGKVSGVYLLPGYNTVVIVNHDGYYTVYGNIANPSVKVGDKVTAGQTLGVLSDNEDDPSRGSIHFEVWKNREKQNPQEWLR